MIELFHALTDWVVGFASSDWAILALVLNSFFESIFFPVPPDPLLIGIAIFRPHLAVWLAALTAVSSVAGALVGYWLGGRLCRPLVYRLFSEPTVHQVERIFNRYGVWATLVAAFTPVPYKVFAIAAGMLELDRRTFIFASLVGRGARFITVGVLLYFYGEEVESFISDNFALATIVLALAVLGAAAAWVLVQRRLRAKNAVR